MKARNENNTIQFYPELPNNLITADGMITGFNYADVATQEANGFFDVVTPEFDFYTQRLGAIYFDEVNRVFTYPVETLEVPIPRPPEPIPTKYITKDEMLRRFTTEEFKGILRASKVSEDIEYWMFRFNAVKDGVNLLDPDTAKGINDLELAGLLGIGRATEILS